MLLGTAYIWRATGPNWTAWHIWVLWSTQTCWEHVGMQPCAVQALAMLLKSCCLLWTKHGSCEAVQHYLLIADWKKHSLDRVRSECSAGFSEVFLLKEGNHDNSAPVLHKLHYFVLSGWRSPFNKVLKIALKVLLMVALGSAKQRQQVMHLLCPLEQRQVVSSGCGIPHESLHVSLC